MKKDNFSNNNIFPNNQFVKNKNNEFCSSEGKIHCVNLAFSRSLNRYHLSENSLVMCIKNLKHVYIFWPSKFDMNLHESKKLCIRMCTAIYSQ